MEQDFFSRREVSRKQIDRKGRSSQAEKRKKSLLKEDISGGNRYHSDALTEDQRFPRQEQGQYTFLHTFLFRSISCRRFARRTKQESTSIQGELSGLYNVAHGAGLAAIWGSWARYVMKNRLERFVRFAVNVMGVTPTDSPEKTALLGIEAVENFYRSIGIPTSLKELGVTPGDAEINEMAKKCMVATGSGIGAIRHLVEADMAAIYRAAR